MRPIDADALKKPIEVVIEYSGFYRPIYQGVAKIIDVAPTLDAEPVRHGYWIAHPHWKHEEYIQGYGYEVCEWVDYSCSCCGKQSVGNSKHNYCPNCGAKMDEVSE